MKCILPIFLLITFVCFPKLQAQFDPFGNNSGHIKTKAKLISELDTIVPGKPFTAAIQLTHPEGWHSFYINPGSIGGSLDVQWKLPEGFKVSPIMWQTPTLGHEPEQPGYEYTGTATHLFTITPANTLTPGAAVTLTAKASWQICSTSCIQESSDFSLPLQVGEKTQPNAESYKLIKQAEKLQPIRESNSSNAGWDIQIIDQGAQYQIKLTPEKNAVPQLSDVYFFSSDLQSNSAGDQKLTPNDSGGYFLTVTKATKDALDNPITRLDHLSGILYSKSGWLKNDSRTGLEFLQLPIQKKPLESAAPSKLLSILGGMLLGGLILNLMPCVFPVIGLKIMGFAQQAGEDKSKVILHGLTFASGVILSFWVLSGILLSLRNAALQGDGQEVGWGYQLQNPYIVLSILLLMFILALNMFGVFEIGTKATSVGGNLQNKQGLTGSFFSGVLATIVATPCSAPFLGAAIGAAFALPNIQFMLAFTAMAVGLALPYLVLSIFPHLVEKLPRPGAWMESFKQGMSFLLFATAGYLLWVYIAQTGLDFMLNIVLGLSLIALALWIYGRWNQPHRTNKVKTLAKVLALGGLIGGTLACLPPDKNKKIIWEPWSEQRAEELISEDTPVFIDFTATWCATCQLNKKRAYPSEIVQLFQDYGITALKADKTNANPAIEKKLQELGRTAIPVNVLYVPGKDEPIITPEILNADYMKKLITENLKKP